MKCEVCGQENVAHYVLDGEGPAVPHLKHRLARRHAAAVEAAAAVVVVESEKPTS